MHIGLMSISQMASRYQVSFRALRFYESRGLLRPVRQGTARFFTAHDRVRVEMILKGKRLGFSLKEIELLIESDPVLESKAAADIVDQLTPQQVRGKLSCLERRHEELQAGIDELRRALAVADHDRLETPVAARLPKTASARL